MTRRIVSFTVSVCLIAGLVVQAQARQPTVSILSQNAKVIAAQEGGQIHIWRRGDNARSRRLGSIKNRVPFRGAVTDSKLIAVIEDGVAVWSGKGFKKRLKLPTPKTLSISRLMISLDGRRGAMLYPFDGGVGDADAVRIWDLHRGTVLKTWQVKAGRILGGAFSDDGRVVALFFDQPGTKNVRLKSFAVKSWRQRLDWRSQKHQTAFAVAVSRRGNKLAIAADNDILYWDLAGKGQPSVVSCDRIKTLFPKALRGPGIRFRGAHQLLFSPKANTLLSLHLFSVVGAAIWALGDSLKPKAWIKRPKGGALLRQAAWADETHPWLVSSGYSADVFLYRADGGRFILQRQFHTAE